MQCCFIAGIFLLSDLGLAGGGQPFGRMNSRKALDSRIRS